MGDYESDEHLRIFKCLIDTGSHVLRNAIEIKILNNSSISFIQYLEIKKHQYFHQLENITRSKCCMGIPHGCNFKGNMDKKMFYKMYNKTAVQNTQDCLDRFEIKAGISLDILDLSDLSFVLWNSGILTTHEQDALMEIMSIRSDICHSPSSHIYPIDELNKYWSDLERAVFMFAEPKSYKDIIELQIETLRKSKLSALEIYKILHSIQQIVNDKTQSFINDKDNELKEREKELEEEARRQTIERFTSLERQIDEKIKDATLVLIDEVSFVREKSEFPDYPTQTTQTTQIIRKKITLDDHIKYLSMTDFVIEALKRSKKRSEEQRKEENAEKKRMIEKIGVTYYESKGMTAYQSKFEEKVPKEREELAKEKSSKEKRHEKKRKICWKV